MTTEEKVVKTPYDEKIAKLEAQRRSSYDMDSQEATGWMGHTLTGHAVWSLTANKESWLKAKREGWLGGYKAGIEAHDCQDTGCPCYQRGQQDAYENPKATGATV